MDALITCTVCDEPCDASVIEASQDGWLHTRDGWLCPPCVDIEGEDAAQPLALPSLRFE